MPIAFPTSPTRLRGPGYPAEAVPCTCGDKRLVVDDECTLCGHLPEHVIRATWARQARRQALGPDDAFQALLTAWARGAVTASSVN